MLSVSTYSEASAVTYNIYYIYNRYNICFLAPLSLIIETSPIVSPKAHRQTFCGQARVQFIFLNNLLVDMLCKGK